MTSGWGLQSRPGSPVPDDPSCESPAWRAVWGCLQANRVYPLPAHMTSREHDKLTPTQAQTWSPQRSCGRLYAVVVNQQAWQPVIAAHGTTTWKKATSTSAA